ncbi:hypothetical protein ACFSB1_16970 [Halopseudomonas phragmitis]|uniref:Uncharacterized protein n=1 Tax=Halopseudomonas phragmitis TaxID=1931241 RepID=A0A1V0B363_9GAMM|nr:hypothetical protein [Halopseudomonas phragmitis]AQZ94378.1 hypothetical protein BVH74_06245 [Halopseudomonas phragmitis]
MPQGKVELYDLMACNVYMDFENTGLPKEQHKFLIAFYPTGGDPVHELIDSITARGPNGYVAEVANQPYTISNLNGHIFDRTTNSHWYMINLYSGFMEPGEYVIEVKCKDGSVKTISRVQDNAPSDKLMAAYLPQRERLKASYQPGQCQPLPAGTALTGVEVTCDSLKELSGVDCWTVFRICEASNSKEFDPQNLYWWDNIFLERFSNPEAGKNRNRIRIPVELKAGSAFTYFSELTDGNTMGGTNICIFQPYQTFYT